ncbi:aspartic proteinase CDR1-like [Papaver somniferum]|uniref:aspartic proteinase CDR1-like n=1 Tax=Papaver somniferum TaxID=3469 RepID=UPI000E7008EC|nr:aspartic proteinase CDR1-like [Papaver somniferum]
MGCGFRQENFKKFIGKNRLRGKSDLIAGILGLEPGPWSFLNQLGVVGEGKFSYCFEVFKYDIEGSNTYLRFGADATIGGASQQVRTTLIVVPQFLSRQCYLKLEDISVGRKRINFPGGTFELKSREGGAIIDTGTTISMIYKDHLDRVADFVKAHFKDLGVEYIGAQESLDVCLRLPGRFDIHNYPSITLHFQQAVTLFQIIKQIL